MKSIYQLFPTIILVFLSVLLTAQYDIGTAGQVSWCYWQDITYRDYSELSADEFFPKTPDGCKTLYSLQAPYKFDDYYGSVTRGFISVDSTVQVRFAVTGDDETELYLSTDETIANLALTAYMDGYTGTTELDKDTTTQWSSYITLVKDEYYYFELRHLEGTGGDHSAIWWQSPFTGMNTWNYVSTDYLYDIIDPTDDCEPRNTSCDDLDANTTNDLWDGHCNCLGEPIDKPDCAGDRFDISRYIYQDISGGSLNDLLLHPNYPSSPNTSQSLDVLSTIYRDRENNTGSLIEGYLYVPVSGTYQFNITGNSRARMFLSLNDDPAFKAAHQMLNINTTDPTEHEDDLSQTMIVNLTANQFYYFEITHKEGTGWEHLGVFWKTPFHIDPNWKRIPSFYLYDYDCELACIPNGTPCDDGDPFTNNDQYTNCECTGTPCTGPDCDSPLANYTSYPDCDITDQLDNNTESSWVSCSVSSNPAGRGNRHWIQYDFGDLYKLYQTQIWNYNVQGQTDRGFSSVAIDYSSDGVTWEQFGPNYTWSLADGTGSYSGFQGPNFNGLGARYILITSLDANHASGCRGIGKVLFNAGGCPQEASACSDGDDFTLNDVIINCNCIGTNTIANDCDTEMLELNNEMLPSDNYSAINQVMSSSMIDKDSLISFVAGDNIQLESNFEVMAGAQFIAQILDCSELSAREELEDMLKKKAGIYLEVTSIDNSEDYIIEFIVPYRSNTKLSILDANGKELRNMLEMELVNPGFYQKVLPGKKLKGHNPIVLLTTDRHQAKQRLEPNQKL